VAIGVLTGCGGSVSVVPDGGGSASASGGSTSSGVASPESSGAAGTSTSGGSGGSSGGSADAGSTRTCPSLDAGGAGACPSTLPVAGCPCAVPGLECEYGGANVEQCDTVAYCGASGWQVQGATAATGDCDSRPTGCPGTFASVPRDAGCTPPMPPSFGAMGVCDYAEGRCQCATGGVNLPYTGSPAQDYWSCQDPGSASCPSPRPRLGSACSSPGLTCSYGGCAVEGGDIQACKNGIWTRVALACPI
jgi:hypothetical protein